MYLGFDTALVSSGTSPGTLPPGGVGRGTDLLIVAHTGEYFSRPFRYPFYWYKWRETSPPGSVQRDFWPLVPGGSKSQKSRLRLNMARNHFALSGPYSSIYREGEHPPPVRPRFDLSPWEMWTRFYPFLAPTFGTFDFITWYITHMFYMLFRVNRASYSVMSTTKYGSANLSSWWGQIYLWTTPVASPLCRRVWGLYLHLFPRDSVHFRGF